MKRVIAAMKHAIYEQGRRAYLAGQHREANPHVIRRGEEHTYTPEAEDWDAGYCAAALEEEFGIKDEDAA